MDNVYEISVSPPVRPVTVPPASTVPAPTLLLLQVPGGLPAEVNVTVNPAQTVSVPVIGLGNAFTVTVILVAQPRWEV